MVRVRVGGVDYVVAPASGGGADSGHARDPGRIGAREFARQAVDEGHAAALASLAFARAEAPPWLDRAALAELVARQIEHGQLKLWARARELPPTSASAIEAPPKLDEDDAEDDEAPALTTWFELRLVDEIGAPIDGVRVAMKPGGTITTNAEGVARVELPQRHSAGAEVASLDELRDVVLPRWDTIRAGPWLDEAPSHSLIALTADPSTSTYLSPERRHTLVIQPWVVRAELDGLVFDVSKSFLLPEAVRAESGVAPIDRLRGWFDAAPDSVALVVGHTDPSGAASYNDPLSLERAESFVAYLRRDVDHWLAWYQHPAWEKRWGGREDQLMLDAVCDRLGLPQGPGRTRAFQAHAGVDVDGAIGTQTRRPLIEAYMDLQDTDKALPPELLVHGCGENFPKLVKPDFAGVEAWIFDPDSEDQRRVEVFLFAAKAGVQPPMPGPNSGPDDPEYPEWVRRARHTEDLRTQPSIANLTVRVVHHPDHHEGPVSEAAVRLIGPEQAEVTRVGVTDEHGLTHFESLSAGRYRVLGDKLGYQNDERVVHVGHSGSKAKAPQDSVKKADDNALGQDADAPPDDGVTELALAPIIEFTSFTGSTPTWKGPPETPEGAEPLADNFVFFQQGESITLEWVIRCPFRPEIELHRRERTPYDGELADWVDASLPLTPDDPENPSVWTGKVELDLNDRLENGEFNLDYRPPRADGVYRLVMRGVFISIEREVLVAGVAFFGALTIEASLLMKCSTTRARRSAGTMTEVPAVHAKPGSLFDHSWLTEPHGYSESEKQVLVAWTVVGAQRTNMQLEILGGEPVAQPHAPDDDWRLDGMSLVKELTSADDGRGQLAVDVPTLTLRAAINVFRLGGPEYLEMAHWESANRLGGSALLIAEDRESRVEKFNFEVKDDKGKVIDVIPMQQRISPVDLLSVDTGYYKAYRIKPSDNSNETLAPEPPQKPFPANYGDTDIALEILERAGAIWAKTFPDRPFGLGELFSPKHQSHFTGLAWDILTLRKDSVREYRQGPQVWIPGVDDPDLKETSGDTVVSKAKQETIVTASSTYDRVGMELLIMLFIDVLDLLSDGGAIRYQQVIFNDQIVKGIKAKRGHVNVGTETIMNHVQGSHGWHVHFQINF